MKAKVPPNSVEAEQGILGGILLDNEAIDKVGDFIKPGDFYNATNRTIYTAILDLYNLNEPVDLVTLTDALKSNNKLEKAGGISYISALTELVPTAGHINAYAKVVKDKSTLRRIIETARSIAVQAYDEPADIDRFIVDSTAAMIDVTESRQIKTIYSMREMIPETIKLIEKIQAEGTHGLKTGISNLDYRIIGLVEADFIILASRPGVGKSSLAFNIARNVANDGDPVGIFSLEMPLTRIMQRLLSGESFINNTSIMFGRIKDSDWKGLVEAANALMKLPIYVDDTLPMTANDIIVRARRMKSEYNVKLIIVDYLQLINASQRGRSREQEVTHIGQTLKAIAKNLNIPVIGISQLNRDLEKREDKRPKLSDLRESGSLEQDGDLIIFLYKKDKEADEVEAIIAKNKYGHIGVAELEFNTEFQLFRNARKEED